MLDAFVTTTYISKESSSAFKDTRVHLVAVAVLSSQLPKAG